MNQDINDERIRQAVEHTETLRLPRQSLASFGMTNIHYYLLTEPVYQEMTGETSETVIREGKVIAERPRVVTPYYLSRLQGFSGEAKRYFDMLLREYGPSAPGLLYGYRNEPTQLNIVADSLPAVVAKINDDIDKRGDTLASIIKGEDDLWDVSLMKFIFDLTRRSIGDNLHELGMRGLLNVDRSGVPADARARIEELFRRVAAGDMEPHELKDELDHWGLFDDYEDRFFALFRKKRLF
jgi:hypothetical protein